MKGIIAKWFQHCLGLVVDMKPENFGLKTANGYLLAQILHHYQIIDDEQLKLVKNDDSPKTVNENLDILSTWLGKINLTLDDDDILEIRNGIGTASLNLFYRVFLEVRDKNTLDFVAENVLRDQIKSNTGRFEVTKVKLETPPLNLQSSELCEPLIENGDILHWYKDRMDNLQAKCIEAKEEYLHSRKKQIRCSLCNQVHETEMHRYFTKSNPEIRVISEEETHPDYIPNEDILSVNGTTYDKLIQKQKDVQALPPFVPDYNKTTEIMQTLKEKQKAKHENRILKNELHRDIMKEFYGKMSKDQDDYKRQHLTQIFEQQSEFEKTLVSKLGQIKLQREMMIENKIMQDQKLNKLKEDQMIEALIVKGKDLDEESIAYYCEKERHLQLHRKLWEERKKEKEAAKKKMITKILQDITDCALKIAEYKKRYGVEPSRRENFDLKNVFLTGEPVFEYVRPVIRILKDQESEFEEIVKETKRQNEIDAEEFERYMNFEYPWELSNVETSPEILQEISLGLNVLGYIIHQIYMTKYPPPSTPERSNFPDCSVRVCINGINDVTCIPTLQNFLSEREIYVVELQQVVDYCLNAYQNESKRENDDDRLDTQPEKNKKAKASKKETKKGAKSKSKGKAKSDMGEEKSEGLEIEPEYETKVAQTPIYFPEQEIPFTPAASLGKTAQEMLASGESLTDFLLVTMFVEYLKVIPNLKGWALINFPTTIEQAAILEEHFTGNVFLPQDSSLPVAGKSITEFQSTSTTETGAYSEGTSDREDREHFTTSRLLPDPTKDVPEEKSIDTMLTAYIKIKKYNPQENVGDTTLPPVLAELDSVEVDPLDRIYSDLGVNYSLYQKEFDYSTIKYLAKLIIGDYSIPQKSSLELFGDIYEGHLESKTVRSAKMGEKAPKKLKGSHPSDIPSKKDAGGGGDADLSPKASNKGGKKDKKEKGKRIKVVIVHEDKATQIPEVEFSPREEETESHAEEPPTPGKPGWKYSTVYPPDELQVALATLWEDVEEIYVEDLKQICFMIRLQMDTLMPFNEHIKEEMRVSIERPDEKAEFLAKFQKAFNAFDMDFRKDEEFKCEMHCRIEDFKEKLSEIADKRMMELEEKRCDLILQNWTPNQICQLLNDYVNMFQIESDRFYETLRLTDDYFMSIITGKTCTTDTPRDDPLPKYNNIAPNIINNMLKNTSQEVDLSFFEEELSKMVKNCLASMKKYHTVSQANLDKAKAVKTASEKKIQKPKAKKETAVGPAVELDREKLDRLVAEWACAIRGEVARVTLRYDLIKTQAMRLIHEFLIVVRDAFHFVYLSIKEKYDTEIINIGNACKVIKSAVETETTLDNALIFIGDQFYINPEVILVEPPLPIQEIELVIDGAFTTTQLSHLTDILFDLAPKGYIPIASFEHLIQDIIWNNPEDGTARLGPKLWEKLDTLGLKKIIEATFDKLEYIYWKDFIIYNLGVSFPTERELLLVRQEFRDCDPDDTELVTDYQFFSIKLWFEWSYPAGHTKQIQDTKKLLYKLYRVKNGGLNYTAMLLDFCKDDMAVLGFTKALELALGRQVCWDSIIGTEFVKAYMKKLKDHEESVALRDGERAEYYKSCYEFVEDLVDYVVHINEDVIIEDITEPKKEDTHGQPSTNEIKPASADKDKSATEVGSVKKVEIIGLDEEEETTEHDLNENNQAEKVTDDENIKAHNLSSKIGFEAIDHSNMAFFLPLDVLISVITSSIPWHCRIKNPGEESFWEEAAAVHVSYQNKDFADLVLAHEYLNSDGFLKLLRRTKKFSARDPIRILKDILNI